MLTIADYLVIRDVSFDLNEGNSQRFGGLLLPADLVPGTHRAKAILAYKIRPPSNPPFAAMTDVRIRVNGHDIGQYRASFDTVRGVWETFYATFLNADSNANLIEFECTLGRAKISDVVLWYQRYI